VTNKWELNSHNQLTRGKERKIILLYFNILDSALKNCSILFREKKPISFITNRNRAISIIPYSRLMYRYYAMHRTRPAPGNTYQ
jgi:hypothetical protein